MLHSAQSSWTVSGDVFSTAAPMPLAAAPAAAIEISGLRTAALVEPLPQGALVAMTTPAAFPHAGPVAEPGSPYSPDLAVLALGLIGAWMLLVGSALMARQLRLVKVSRNG